MKICRRETFNSAHRLFVESWSDERNQEVFGKCSNPNYHGHNYVIETWLEGSIDPLTGYVYDLGLLKKLIHDTIIDRFDHRNLNLDCPEFNGINPTAENIAIICYNLLKSSLPEHLNLTIRLYETDKNWVEYSGQ